ncbi:hypothetical protein F2Q69_00042857 [Brassica cretica]|uniref:Uncharacterized protein n=1 Tax=Brassica cretica TaxID=69181 RepID=A0A8S9NJ39_BRACR|nr:hypothetical protein F2Q69_00042857 [Brassica cretica]
MVLVLNMPGRSLLHAENVPLSAPAVPAAAAEQLVPTLECSWLVIVTYSPCAFLRSAPAVPAAIEQLVPALEWSAATVASAAA